MSDDSFQTALVKMVTYLSNCSDNLNCCNVMVILQTSIICLESRIMSRIIHLACVFFCPYASVMECDCHSMLSKWGHLSLNDSK